MVSIRIMVLASVMVSASGMVLAHLEASAHFIVLGAEMMMRFGIVKLLVQKCLVCAKKLLL